MKRILPGFPVTFFTHGEHLVPVVRDILRPPGLILSPGRVGSEPGDGSLSRAFFPFIEVDELDRPAGNKGKRTPGGARPWDAGRVAARNVSPAVGLTPQTGQRRSQGCAGTVPLSDRPPTRQCTRPVSSRRTPPAAIAR